MSDSPGYLRAEIAQCPAYGWIARPQFNTKITTMANGRENRNAMWANARHAYSAPFQNIKPESYRNIKQMHYVCRGMAGCFQFKDQLDHLAENEIFGYGDGTTAVFQLRKISTIDGVSYDRDCFVIKPGAVFTDNLSPVSPTVDLDRGTVTFSVAPASSHVLRWTGEFRVWVRFDQDDLPFSLDNKNAVNGTVELIEVPPPGVGE